MSELVIKSVVYIDDGGDQPCVTVDLKYAVNTTKSRLIVLSKCLDASSYNDVDNFILDNTPTYRLNLDNNKDYKFLLEETSSLGSSSITDCKCLMLNLPCRPMFVNDHVQYLKALTLSTNVKDKYPNNEFTINFDVIDINNPCSSIAVTKTNHDLINRDGNYSFHICDLNVDTEYLITYYIEYTLDGILYRTLSSSELNIWTVNGPSRISNLEIKYDTFTSGDQGCFPVTGKFNSPNSLVLSWDAPNNLDGDSDCTTVPCNYKINRSIDDNTYELLDTVESLLQYTDTDVSAGTTYYYSVTPSIGGVDGPVQKIHAPFLTAPSILEIIVDNIHKGTSGNSYVYAPLSQVRVSWDHSLVSLGGYNLLDTSVYMLDRHTDPSVQFFDPSLLEYAPLVINQTILSNLHYGTTYTRNFHCHVTHDMSNLDTNNMPDVGVFPTEPFTVNFTPYNNPTDPTNVTVDIQCVNWDATNSSATVSWDSSEDRGLSGELSYVICAYVVDPPGTGAPPGIPGTTIRTDGNSVTFSHLTPGETYTFSLYASQTNDGIVANSETVYVTGKTERTSSMVNSFTVNYKNSGYSLSNSSEVAPLGTASVKDVLEKVVLKATVPTTRSAPDGSVYNLTMTDVNTFATSMRVVGSDANNTSDIFSTGGVDCMMGTTDDTYDSNYKFKVGSNIVDNPDCQGQYTNEVTKRKYVVPSAVKNITLTPTRSRDDDDHTTNVYVVNWDTPDVRVGDIYYEVFVNGVFKNLTSNTTYSISSPAFNRLYTVVVRPYRKLTINDVTNAYIGPEASASGYYWKTPTITLSSSIASGQVTHTITPQLNGVNLVRYDLNRSSITGTKSSTVDNLVYNGPNVVTSSLSRLLSNIYNTTVDNVLNTGKYTYTVTMIWTDPNTNVQYNIESNSQTVINSGDPTVQLKTKLNNTLTFTVFNNWADVTKHMTFIVPTDYLTSVLPDNNDLFRSASMDTRIVQTGGNITNFDFSVNFNTNNVLKDMCIVSNANGMGYVLNA